jgi:hypothetical protein
MSKNNKGDLIQMDNIVVSKSKANHHSYTITIALWQLLFLRVSAQAKASMMELKPWNK